MIQNIGIERLHPHPKNPRKSVGDVAELADSIKAQGILQNLTVVPLDLVDPDAAVSLGDGHYAVVIGNRRLAAAVFAGLDEVPCVISNMPLREQISVMLLENIQRADLTVLEQADGFQMMLDLGETISSIVKKTGFSDATIRHRVRLMELKRDKLEAAVTRGGTIMDYIALEQIKSTKLKNEVLEAIGTNNFKWKLEQAIEEEATEKRKEKMIAFFDGWATKVKDQPKDTSQIKWFHSYKLEGFKKPEDAGEVEYFYTMERYGTTLYKTADAPEKKEKTEAEKSFSKREAALKKLSKRAFELRYAFVKEFGATKKHSAEINLLVFRRLTQYSHADLNNILKLLDIEKPEGEDYNIEVQKAKRELIFERYNKQPERTMLLAAYACFDDKPSNDYFHAQSWSLEIEHEKNSSLDVLYDTLIALGYEMSDEEQQLREGTHELFVNPEPENRPDAEPAVEAEQDTEAEDQSETE